VEKELEGAGAKTLMWSLDGVLRYVPVAALHDGKEYLVEKYRNVVFTPASQSNLKDMPQEQWKGLGLGVSKAQTGFNPLPAVPKELHEIIREENSRDLSEGVIPGKVMLDEDFTQTTMFSALQQRYPVVHIASHFQFQPGSDEDSFLLLGDGSHLTLAQLDESQNAFDGVDLLTLSACNTATGDNGADGKEVEGFGVLAQRQGAKAVVASLWPVADESTQWLMREFYRLREAQPRKSKAEALQQAQIELLHGEIKSTDPTTGQRSQPETIAGGDPAAGERNFKPDPKAPFAHPYYWAPFILIGNSR
jgi:CHAT domain-containing protein